MSHPTVRDSSVDSYSSSSTKNKRRQLEYSTDSEVTHPAVRDSTVDSYSSSSLPTSKNKRRQLDYSTVSDLSHPAVRKSTVDSYSSSTPLDSSSSFPSGEIYNQRSILTSPVSLGESNRNNTKLTRFTSSKSSKSKHVSFTDSPNSPNNSLNSESESENPVSLNSRSKVKKHRLRSSVNDLENREPKTGELEGDLKEYEYLVGKIHRDDEDLQRYVTERIYVDRRTKYILGIRSLLRKDGSKHISTDPSPIHVQSLVEMTKQYEQESSPSSHRALIAQLISASKGEEEFTSTANVTINCNDAVCLQSTILEVNTNESETFTKLLLSKLRGDELVNYCLETSISIGSILTPTTRKQAMATPEREFWLDAEKKEINSINMKKVLEPAQLPRGRRLLNTKWVYKIKYGAQGELSSYKVRLVACGYSQVFGIDFDETYSPVIRLTSMRLLFAISAQLGLKIHQMDVNTAFLHADISEEIYIRPPEGFPLTQGMNCFRLKKALYGLKQAPREWYNNMNGFLLSINFQRLSGESCLYFRRDDNDGTICIISLYVDDLLIAGSSLAIINRVKNQLKDNYDMKDLGVVKHILGCEVKHEEDTGTSYLTQYQYTKKAIEKFFGTELKPSETPADSNVVLSKSMSPYYRRGERRNEENSIQRSCRYITMVIPRNKT